LQARNAHFKSTIEQGKAMVEVEVEGKGVYTVELKGERLHIRSGRASIPLLSWRVPLDLLKDVLLGKERILYALLDKRCRLSFDTPNFTHWNGTTALKVILSACEMVKRSPEMRRLVEEL
jgi:hypothetical protein